jgi:hypothetical protein
VDVFASDAKSFTYEWTYSEDGTTWKPVAKGKATKTSDTPKTPGPEHQKLAMGTGKWKVEVNYLTSPFGPAGKETLTQESRIILDGFFLENRWRSVQASAGLEGAGAGLEIIAYDPDKSVYQSCWFDSTGNFPRSWKPDVATCTIAGDTWHWCWTEEKDGKIYQCREVDVFATNRQSFTAEDTYSEDGTTWKQRSELKAVKVSGAAAK